MIYNILVEADKHWGALRAENQYQSSYITKRVLADLPIDLYVNLGDVFDTRTFINSAAGVYAVKDMHEKAEICKERGIPIRVVRGTYSHDYNQLEIFNNLMMDPSYNFKYFNELSVEETLPGLQALYCPDENMNFTKYVNRYFNDIVGAKAKIAFCHGNFDVILPDIALDAFSQETSTTLVFNYSDMRRQVRGPMIAGHWHDASEHGHLYYVGSQDRWKFGEDEEKGIAIVQYNTETEQYKYIRIPNPLAPNYFTYDVHTSLYFNTESYVALIEAIDASLAADPKMRIRVYITIDVMQTDTEEQINELKYHFTNEKRVSFTISNKLREKTKEKEKELTVATEQTFGFVKDQSLTLEEKLQRWIKLTTGREYTTEQIHKIIGPYIGKL